MRYSRCLILIFLAAFLPINADASSPRSSGPTWPNYQASEGNWPNYMWPRNEQPTQMYEPDYGTTEKYLDAMKDVERSLKNLPAEPQRGFAGQPSPPYTAQQQAIPYPPQMMQPPIQAGSAPNAYPPSYAPYQAGSVPQSGYPAPPQAPVYDPNNPVYQSQTYNPRGLNEVRHNSGEQYQSQPSEYWHLGFGAGLGYMPEFEGSDENRLRFLPIVDVRYKDTFFLNTSLGAGINVYNQQGLRAGPFVTINFGRDDDDAPYLIGAGDVDPTLESGVFFEKNFDPLTFLWTARYAMFNRGHAGLVSDAELSYRMMLQPGFYGMVNGSVSWASKNYMDAFFGVSGAHSQASGLAAYDADAGFKDIGIGGGLQFLVDDHISVMLNASIKKLVGEAANSPIVKAGDETQYYGGTGVLYTF